MSGNSANIHIGHALISMSEQGETAVPADWSTLTDVGYIDPEVGGVFKPSQEIKATNVARFQGPIKATKLRGDATIEFAMLESDIGNIAWALGGAAADIVDDAENDEKTFKGPRASGPVQEFNLMVTQAQNAGTLNNYIRIPRAYISQQPEILVKEDGERVLKLTIGTLVVEDSGDWQGFGYEIVEEYEGV